MVVLEAGPNLTTDPLVLSPLATQIVDLNAKYSKTFATRQGNINLANFAYTEGRMWGGSSAHNGLWTVRGTPFLYDQWATISGNPQWTYDNLLPIMKGMETYTPNGTPINTAQRGTAGALFVTQEQPPSSYNTNVFCAQLAATGQTTLVDDYNVAAATTGISAQQQFVTPGANSIRSFSANAFLPPSVVTPNGIGVGGRKLHIVSQATVSRVIFNGNTAVGVEYILDGNREQVFRIFANKKVILCAGTTDTTRIMLQSGIGDPAELTPLGIPVVVNNRLVGKNLQNHYGAFFISNTGPADVAYAPFTPPFTFFESFFDLSISPLLANNPLSYTTSFANDGIRRMQMVFWGGPSLFATFNSVLLALGVDINPFSMASNAYVALLTQVNSKGTITISDTDPLTIPQVNFNFYDPLTGQNDPSIAGSDANKIVAFAKILRATMRTFTGVPQGDMIYPTPAQYGTDAELFLALQQVPIVAYHSVGTCTMGTSINDGVVDGNLNVFGVNNLMIADNSVQPVINDGNTGYPAFIIGLKAAQILGATVPTA